MFMRECPYMFTASSLPHVLEASSELTELFDLGISPNLMTSYFLNFPDPCNFTIDGLKSLMGIEPYIFKIVL